MTRKSLESTAAAAASLSLAMRRFETLCRERGERLTRQRRAVVRQLLTAGRALSAYELLERLRPEDDRATAASVYRTLDFLMELGVVHRLESQRSFVLCRHPEAPHRVQFLICRCCGEVVEAEDARLAAATERLGDRLGFALDQRIVELTGLCGRCRDGDAGSLRDLPGSR
jgi:Fur family transcriptional regulator, zinc uptake regulator